METKKRSDAQGLSDFPQETWDKLQRERERRIEEGGGFKDRLSKEAKRWI